MKKCPQCQKEFSDDNKFCPECGVELEEIAAAAQEAAPAAAATEGAQETPAAAPADAPAPDKKKSKLPLILALCGVLVVGVVVGLIAGGAFSKKETEPKQETTAKKSDDSDKKEAAKALKDKTKKDDQKDDKKDQGENFYQGEWCSFSYPESWVGKVRIEENVYETLRSISISMDELNDYGAYPLLYQIDLSDYPYVEDPPASADDYYYNPGYRETLGVSTTGVYAHLSGPTDVQFDPSQQAEYQQLYEADLSVIRNSFKFNY